MMRTLLFLGCFAFTAPTAFGLDWPQWRGPDRTDVSAEKGLLNEWPGGGPRRLWLYDKAGTGYSSFSIVNGKLFTMGTRDDSEVILCLDAETGKELWAAPIASPFDNDRGDGPRGTPSVDGERVYALGGQGTLVCVKAQDGKPLWRATMQELGGKPPHWGYSESVLVDGGKVICTPGRSRGAIAAFDKVTGKLAWQSKEFTDEAQYSSIISAEHGGVRQYIQLTLRSLVGISPEDGKLLWKSPWPGETAVIPTPIHEDGLVYVTAGYGVGCKVVKLDGKSNPADVYFNKEMKNHHGGVIKVGDHIYGYSDGAGWICQEFKTGKVVWREKKLGKGAIACAGGMLYCLAEDDGTVALIEASPEGWKEHGRFKLAPLSKIRKPKGRIWTHPVISNGRLYLRDQDHIYCFDVKAG